MVDVTSFKYRAFLSYSHADKGWARSLHRSLEAYRVDKDLVGRQTPAGPVPKTLRPIFRDRDDFSAGHSLTAQTASALEASQFLIVICSPNAAKSRYVNEEIRRFKVLGGSQQVIPVIAGGAVNISVDECFPPALGFRVGPDGALTKDWEEPIASDARPTGDGKNLAIQKIVAALLGLPLDEVVRRAERAQKRQKRIRYGIITALCSLAVASTVGFTWARRELVRNEALLSRTLERATNLVSNATDLSNRFGVLQSISLQMLEEAEGLFKDMAELGRDSSQLRYRKASMLLAFARNYEALGRTDMRHQRTMEAHKLLQRLANDDPNNLDWQNDLSVSYEAVGDLLVAEGSAENALKAYNAGLIIREHLAFGHPTNAVLQRNVSVLRLRLGDVFGAQGNRAAAMNNYLAAETILSDTLKYGANEILLRDLADIEERIAKMLAEEGKLEEALRHHRAVVDAQRTLIEVDPKNTLAVSDLSITHREIGNILRLEGKLDEAVENYRSALLLANRLTESDDANAIWQSGLAGLHSGIALVFAAQAHIDELFTRPPDVLERQKLSNALDEFRACLAILVRLVNVDGSNSAWRSQLGNTYADMGRVLDAEGNPDEAMANYKNAFAIRKELADLDPSNNDWQSDLLTSYDVIGAALAKQGKVEEALRNFQAGHLIAERLTARDPKNADWKANAIASNIFFASLDSDPLPRLEAVAADLRKLQSEGKLPPAKAHWVAVVEQLLIRARKMH